MLEASTDVVIRRRLQPGQQVGKHLVIRSVLGSGGTAVVYEAVHTRLNTAVALKVAHVTTHADDDAPARLEREARVCASIEDPRVPRVYDVGELEDGRPYLVMQKVAGQTLEEVMAQGRIAPRTALRIVREVLCALDTVHANGVVHRDIKPSNVIARFEERGFPRVHVMDFGVSKETSSRGSEPALTRPGSIVGTPLYMAPEQMAGDPVDSRADLYSVGVLLYEMLAGRAPFVGCSTAEVMAAVLRRDHEPLDRVWPEAPLPLVSFVARAMAERAAERFVSAREMREALERVMYTVDAPTPPQNSVRAPSPSLPHGSWAALAIAAFCALIVGSSSRKVGEGAPPLAPAAALVAEQSAPEPLVAAPAPAVVRAPETARERPLAPLPGASEVAGPAPAPAAPVRAQVPARKVAVPQARMPAKPRTVAPSRAADSLLHASLRELEALRGTLEAPQTSGATAVDAAAD